MRLKLEEEYLQNTKNHEEEVQLRLKFESKLNDMHSAHRELQTKYFRCRKDLEEATNSNKQHEENLVIKVDEITALNQETL